MRQSQIIHPRDFRGHTSGSHTTYVVLTALHKRKVVRIPDIQTCSLQLQVYLSSTVISIPDSTSSPRNRARTSPTVSQTAVYSPRGCSSDDRRAPYYPHGHQVLASHQSVHILSHAACKIGNDI